MASNPFKVKLTNVRLSFPALFTPEKNTNDNGEVRKSWKASFLMDKDKHADLIEQIEDTIEDVIADKWGKNPPKLKAEKKCLRDGDDEDYDGYADMMYLSARSYSRPPVVDRDRSPLVEEDGKPYAGCYVNAVVHLWAQDNDNGKRVNASLEAVQFVKDGDAFGRAPVDVDEEFDDIDDGDEDEAPRRKRRSRDDDEDEAPRRKRRSRDDEDDEDEAPRRKRRSRDDDDLL